MMPIIRRRNFWTSYLSTTRRNMEEVLQTISSTWNAAKKIWISLHPRKLTWNLKMKPWKRRFLLKTIIFRFHVSFRGSIDYWIYWTWIWCKNIRHTHATHNKTWISSMQRKKSHSEKSFIRLPSWWFQGSGCHSGGHRRTQRSVAPRQDQAWST